MQLYRIIITSSALLSLKYSYIALLSLPAHYYHFQRIIITKIQLYRIIITPSAFYSARSLKYSYIALLSLPAHYYH
jgi:hypothetical protein